MGPAIVTSSRLSIAVKRQDNPQQVGEMLKEHRYIP